MTVPSAGAGPTTSVSAAEAKVASARRDREQAESRLAEVRARKAAVQAELDRLSGSDVALTTEIAEARRQVREFAVAAFIDGGRTEILQSSLSPEQASALAWRTGLVSGQAGQAADAADQFEALKQANDPDRVQAAEELDHATTEEAEAASDLVQASALERDAEAELAAAKDAAAASAAAAARAKQAATSAPVGKPVAAATPKAAKKPATTSAAGVGPSASVGDATPDELAFLAKVRQCESRGDYTVVSSTGRYRGAYQFSVETWRGVGGTGDPAAASPAEQDYRALKLLRLQGKRAWPVCSTR